MESRRAIEIIKNFALRSGLDGNRMLTDDEFSAIAAAQVALEKSIEKRPVLVKGHPNDFYTCPFCGSMYIDYLCCGCCGQAIDKEGMK